MEAQQKYQPGDKAIVTGNANSFSFVYHTFAIGASVQIMSKQYHSGIKYNGYIYECKDDEGNIQSVRETHLSPLTTTT